MQGVLPTWSIICDILLLYPLKMKSLNWHPEYSISGPYLNVHFFNCLIILLILGVKDIQSSSRIFPVLIHF